MSMGERIAALRKQNGFSQEYLAEKLEVSRQAVSKWEQDLTNPDTGNLIKLSELFNVSVEFLSTGKGVLKDNETKSEKELKRKPYLVLVIIACAIIHLVLAICGKVNIVSVISLPMICAFISLIMYTAFSSMLKSGNYDMLAGYSKKEMTLRQ